MSTEEFKSMVAGWIRSGTADCDLAENRTARFNDVYDLLREGVAHFWFRKADGSSRGAYGTLARAIIERHSGSPEGNDRRGRTFSGAVSYYDLEKDAWRSFRADSVQEIDFEYGKGEL